MTGNDALSIDVAEQLHSAIGRFDTDWRWMLDRNDSPWYRSVKLYRHDESWSWKPVLQRAAVDLAALANAPCAGPAT